MTQHDPYAFLGVMAGEHFVYRQNRPTLSLVSSNHSTPIGENSMPKPSQPNSTQRETASPSTRKPEANTANIPAVPPLHEHGAFCDMGAAINRLTLGADALKGIGAMMQPSMVAHDAQLNEARRSDIAAIFRFFGEVLSEPAQHVSHAAQRLEWDVANKY